MIKNQNILATLMIFLSQLKTLMKSFIQKRKTSKTPYDSCPKNQIWNRVRLSLRGKKLSYTKSFKIDQKGN